MNLFAARRNLLEKGREPACVHQFLDLTVIDGRAKAPRESFDSGLARRRRAGCDTGKRVAEPVHGKAHCMRKLLIEEKESCDPFGVHRRGVKLRIGLERGAEFEEHDPVEVARLYFRRPAEVDIEKTADQLCAFAVAAEFEEIPAFAVAQRRDGDTFEGLEFLENLAEETRGLMYPDRPCRHG